MKIKARDIHSTKTSKIKAVVISSYSKKRATSKKAGCGCGGK